MISHSVEALIRVVSRAARMHGSSVSLAEIAQLLPGETDLQELASAFETLPSLREDYTLKDGLVYPKGDNHPSTTVESNRLMLSIANIGVARVLSSILGGREAVLIAVSGSTSYLSASEQDDIDLFCVTQSGRMWLFLTKALLLLRAHRLLRRSNRPLSLSCVMDERYAETIFGEDRGPLFARDALMIEVVRGEGAYSKLLESAAWMKLYFPKLYALRRGSERDGRPREAGYVRRNFADLFLYLTVGSYVRLKAKVHNRQLAGQGKSSARFLPRVGKDHLVYESMRYRTLNAIYSNIRPVKDYQKYRSLHDGGTLLPNT